MPTDKVFVSHTSDMAQFPEVRSFVQAVVDAVNRAEMAPVEMRHFTAWDGSPADYCRARVRECEIYVAVIGFRYGSMVPGEAVSYTELEFDEATAAGLRRLVFLLDDAAVLPSELTDLDRGAVEGFRQRLCDAGLLVRSFTSDLNLELEAYAALKDLADRTRQAAPRAAFTGRYEEPQVIRTAARWRQRLLTVLFAMSMYAVAFGVLANVPGAGPATNAARWALPLLLMLLAGTVWVIMPYLPGRHRELAEGGEQAQLDQAVRQLSGAVRDQWIASVAGRGLQRPDPLRVRWSATHRPMATEPSVPQDEHGLLSPLARSAMRGDVRDIVATFRSLPRRQLLVLGEPGAGKSVVALMLTTGLLDHPEPGDPVPVLLPLSSWRPSAEHLHSWVARRLAEEYNFRADTARKLVTTGRILPVLDGLDEIPAALHVAAIEGIERAASTRPLVVTCRTAEYKAAVAEGGWVLASALVVELEPVRIEDAARFLTATPPEAARWRPVFARLGSQSSTPLARTLSSPLMVSLARTTYRLPATEPVELLDANRFPDVSAVEHHLLGSFVAAAYADYPTFSDGSRRRSFTCNADTAERWLTFLACHLNRLGTADLAWWRVSQALPGPAVGFLAGLTSALSVALPLGIAIGVVGRPVNGLIFGFAFGLTVGLAAGIANHMTVGLRVERPTRLRTQVSLRALGLGVRVGLLIGLVGAIIFGIQAYPFGIARVLETGLVVALLATVAFGGAFAVNDARAEPSQASPASELRADRFTRLVFGVGLGLLVGVPFGLLVGPAFGVGGGLTAGIAMASSGAYFRFGQARLWLAWQRRLPLRLMSFLRDAHDREVLRQVGTVYQFRHNRLQEHLVTKARDAVRREVL